MRTGKVKVMFNSTPVEIKPDSVVLAVNGEQHQIPAPFAGGIPPNDLLKKIGIGFGKRDMTVEASKEAKQAAQAARQLVQG